MLTLNDIKKLYEKYNVKASKRFGQNFLIDQNILKKIIEVSNCQDKDVIEIGPGLGSLTLFLLEKSKKVTSYEVDEDMIKVLKSEILNEKFNLIEGDFLKQNLKWKNKKTIVANIPYNITSDILFKLFENAESIESATLMVQKEVAERITSSVSSKQYGKLAITAQHFADIKYEFTVPENAFMPAPKVKSAIITLKFKEVNFEKSKDFMSFVKNSFSMRRKTLYNNFKNFMNAEDAKYLIEKNHLNPSIRPQELSYVQYVELFEKYSNIVKY